MTALPTVTYTLELNDGLVPDLVLEAVQGSDVQIEVVLTRDGTPIDHDDMELKVNLSSPDRTTWIRSVTGDAGATAAASLFAELTPAELDNSGRMLIDLVVLDGSLNVIQARGICILYPEVPDSGTLPAGNVIDWSNPTSYLNTATHGPVRPHSGTLEVKATNADGSISIGVKDGLYDPAGSAATVAGNLTAHIDDTTAAHAATAISNTPAGGIAATTVQAAINELDSEKLAVGGTAADVNPAGTAIAAALASAASAVNLTGTEPSGATQGSTRIARLATGQVAPTSIGVGAVDLQHTRTVATRSASGSGSFTAGINNTASGAGSVALGDGNTASNFRSIALGFSNTASGVNAVAMGNTNTASGEAAVCIRGATNTASGIYALAGGSQSLASGAASVADGVLTKATGTLSRATGRKAESLHDGAMVEVDNTDAVLASTLADQRTARFAGGYRWNGGDHRMEGSVFAPPKIVTTSITAELDGVYHGTAAATYTDPTPADGRGFVVRVVNGTQTVGGTAYTAEGTVIFREYHSGAWRNRVLFGGADAAGVRTNIGLPPATEAEMRAGTVTDPRAMSPQRVAQAALEMSVGCKVTPMIFDATAWTSTVTGVGAAINRFFGSLALACGAVTPSTAMSNYALSSYRGFKGAHDIDGIPFSKPLIVAAKIIPDLGKSANGTRGILIGPRASDGFNTALTRLGFGVRFVTDGAFLVAHNGTSETASAKVSYTYTNRISLILYSDGAGNVSMWLGNGLTMASTPTATITGGPAVDQSATNGPSLRVFSDNGADTTANAIVVTEMNLITP
jgi:hypothetical protein